jgi:hypothetical protein
MSAQNPAQDAFELWKKAMDEGTQAWVRALGQSAAPPAAPAMSDFSQFWRPILSQGMEIWQKAAAQGGVSPEFAQQWKAFLDQWVEVWSRSLGQAMATEGFAQALGRYLDQTLAAQAPLRKGMEQYTDQALRTLGLPSRSQVVALASQLVALEERLEGLEDRLDEIRELLGRSSRSADRADATGQGRAPTARRPARSTAGPKEAR